MSAAAGEQFENKSTVVCGHLLRLAKAFKLGSCGRAPVRRLLRSRPEAMPANEELTARRAGRIFAAQIYIEAHFAGRKSLL
jgi:hypothetical protein